MFSRMPFKRLGTLLKNSGPDQEINGNIFFSQRRTLLPITLFLTWLEAGAFRLDFSLK